MGKTYTIPVVVEEWTRLGWRHFGKWEKKVHGNPSAENLTRYRQTFINSTRPGGCNEHLGLSNTSNLRIRRQRDNAVLATFSAPLFEIV